MFNHHDLCITLRFRNNLLLFIDVQTAQLLNYEDEDIASTFIRVGNSSHDILLCHYGEYIKTMHFKNNQGFKREYIVSM